MFPRKDMYYVCITVVVLQQNIASVEPFVGIGTFHGEVTLLQNYICTPLKTGLL